MSRLSARPVSSRFLKMSIVDPQGFRVEQPEQKLLLKRLKPVETGYHLNLCCMNGTRQSLLNHIIDWVANESSHENVQQSNTYWFYGSPGIRKTSLAHSICASLHERNHLAGAFFCRRDDPNLSEPINILPTFIHKLALLFPPFRSIVAKHLRDDSKCNKTGRWPALFLTLSLTLWRSLHYITLLYITLGRSFITLLYSTLPLGGLFITLHYSTLLGTLFYSLLYICALYGGRW